MRTDQLLPQVRTRLFLDASLPTWSHTIAIAELSCGPVYPHRDGVIQLAVLLEKFYEQFTP
jgi:hypothetical protein